MNLKKNGKIFMSKFVGTGPSSYEKKNLPARGLTKVEKQCCNLSLNKLNCIGFEYRVFGIAVNTFRNAYFEIIIRKYNGVLLI